MNCNLKLALTVMRWTAQKGYLRPAGGLSDVAAELGITPETLSEYFLRRRGVPFLRWRKECRMAYAKRLLKKNPDMPLAELGTAVGVPDKSDMRRQFMEVYGFSPAEYVRAQNKRI